MILGSFFWGYICTEFPGGRLAEIIGTKRVFGYSMLASSFITLLTPLAATLGYTAVVVLRVVLGFMLVRRYFISGNHYNCKINKYTRPPSEKRSNRRNSESIEHIFSSSARNPITLIVRVSRDCKTITRSLLTISQNRFVS